MTKTLIKKQLMEVFAWLYMALMGIVSVTLGVFGSFLTHFPLCIRQRTMIFCLQCRSLNGVC